MSESADPALDSKRHFDAKRAQVYDGLIRQVVPGYDTLHAMTRVLLRREVGEAARVLVVGAGTGAEIVELGRAFPGWRFVGVDPSAEMLAVAGERLRREDLAGRVDLVEGYCHDLPAGASFDAATLMLVMHFVADDPAAPGGGKAGLLAAVAARLKPGAPLVLADLHAEAGGARFNRLVAAWRDWQLAAGIPPEDVDKGFRHIVKDIRFVPEGRILDLLHGAGFAAVEPFYGAYLFGGWIAWKG